MKSVWQPEVRAELVARAAQVRGDKAPGWGTMTAPEMMAHLADSLRMALGEIAVAPRAPLLKFPPLRHAIIYWLPFPKGAPTAPELRARTADDLTAEVEAIRGLLETFSTRDVNGRWARHAAFGALTGADWGVLVYRHTDHHLRQFGV
jgi:hypothetical protein